jgi:hypothetical protein
MIWFRHDINQDQFAKWMDSMCRAAESMPSLRRGSLIFSLRLERYDDIGVEFNKMESGEKLWRLLFGGLNTVSVHKNLESILKQRINRLARVEVVDWYNILRGTTLDYEKHECIERWLAC